MLAKTHTAFALALSSIPIAFWNTQIEPLNPQNIVTFFSMTAFGALVPDVDEPNSTIGRKMVIISNIIKSFFGHRGMTHSIIIPLFLSVLLLASAIFLPIPPMFLWGCGGFILGIFLHILGDCMTKSGVPIILPFSTRSFFALPSVLRFKTGGAVDRLLFLACSGIFIAVCAEILGIDIPYSQIANSFSSFL